MYYPVSGGVEKKIESWKIIVPLYDNKGKRFRKEIIDAIKMKIVGEFGGFSGINTIGGWESGKRVFYDKSTTIIIDVPVRDHNKASNFFTALKEELRQKLCQEKIYITYESSASELLSINEFLQELEFYTPSDQPLSLTQEEINKLVEQSTNLQLRKSYKTIRLERNIETGTIIWEREILGIHISTKINDEFPQDAVILPADNLENYFEKDIFGKPLVVIGDYEYQTFILAKEKRGYVLSPESLTRYDKGDEEPHFYHRWHGALKTSTFISVYIEELLTNYIILREIGGQQEQIKMIVGAEGSLQIGGGAMLHCPAYIPDKEIQKAILDNFIEAKNLYENRTLDEITLMQIKVLNKYNEKKAILAGSKKLKDM